MASAGAGGSLPPNFILTPQQQNLLFAALNSNKAAAAANSGNPISLSPDSFTSPQLQNSDGNGFQESPFLDNYDYEFGDSSFDFSFASANGDQPRMIGDVPGTSSSGSPEKDSPENESSEKRSHPDDDDDDGSIGGDSKRQDKIPKKPGRKPLTSEPSSKRKAQNRAAQRAFRERKEKHLKDLETKVEELQKESDAANNENTLLRAQVERMTAELAQYKQKMSLLSSSNSNKPLPREKVHPFGNAAVNNLSDVSFQFEFPKFGMLPGPPKTSASPTQGTSPRHKTQSASPSASIGNEQQSPQVSQQSIGDAQFRDELAKFSSAFTPSMSSSITNASRASLDSANLSLNGANTSSPSASSHSHGGPSSSCGTSPEPFTQSPMASKPVETLTTIGEEQPSMSTIEQPFTQFADIDISNSNFDWLSQQNGGNFDPQLFGNYRETQDNILSNPSFDELFNDSIDADFFTPYNMPMGSNAPAPKKNLIEQIDAQQNSPDEEFSKKQHMNCSQIWDKLQTLPKAQNGEFDLDGLCSELTKKAKCSGSGPVVGEHDFDTILQKYMGKDVSANTMATSLGVEVSREKETSLGLSLP